MFTHFKREEDATMTRGKLDEELARMSDIADYIGLKSLLLCNESFASTNEREGLPDRPRRHRRLAPRRASRSSFVTHLYDLAHSLHQPPDRNTLFLRAERRDDGARTFRLMPAEP